MREDVTPYRWQDVIMDIITEKWNIGDTFTIRDIYFNEKRISYTFPENRHVREGIRNTVYFLRDNKYIELVDYRGTYKRLR